MSKILTRVLVMLLMGYVVLQVAQRQAARTEQALIARKQQSAAAKGQASAAAQPVATKPNLDARSPEPTGRQDAGTRAPLR